MGFDKWNIFTNSPDEENVFYSGQTIKGKVVIDQDKEKSFRGVYVELKGYCRVKWSKIRYTEYKYQEYVNEKLYIISSRDGKFKMQPGHYEYPYQFTIPPDCPASYEGKHGHIRYELNLVVDRTLLKNQVKSVCIRAITPLDLNPLPDIKDPIRLEVNKTYGSRRAGSNHIDASVTCPVSGFCPGQYIPLEITCDNTSSTNVRKIQVALMQVTTYYATRKKVSVAEVTSVAVWPVLQRSILKQQLELRVPKQTALNVRNCSLIDVDYYLKLTVKPHHRRSFSSKLHRIVIGTVSLREPDQLEQDAPIEVSTPSSPSPLPVPPSSQPSPPTSQASPPTTLPSPPACQSSAPSTLPSPSTCQPSPPTCQPSSPTIQASSPASLPTPLTCLPSQATYLPSPPTYLPSPPTYLPAPTTYPPFPPTYPYTQPTYPPTQPAYLPFQNPMAHATYFNGIPCANPSNNLYPYSGSCNLYPFHPPYTGDGFLATTNQPPRYSLSREAPSAPEADADTRDN
ncbi:arrestin domain-containing protein 2-like [Epargyreus clarus]|uniref:arrestin domain-containing protein 2-like n=1 Tax=Epargyreus clarus TaxID=520877 RepID=UPI003C2D4152